MKILFALLIALPLLVSAGEHAGKAAKEKSEHAGKAAEHAGKAAEKKSEHAGKAAEHAGEAAEEKHHHHDH